jgi:hypothetical protein
VGVTAIVVVVVGRVVARAGPNELRDL